MCVLDSVIEFDRMVQTTQLGFRLKQANCHHTKKEGGRQQHNPKQGAGKAALPKRRKRKQCTTQQGKGGESNTTQKEEEKAVMSRGEGGKGANISSHGSQWHPVLQLQYPNK